MKRARVRKVNDGEPDPWVVFVMGEDWLRKSEPDFPTHAAALAHALAEVGLARSVEHREAP